MLTPEQIAKIRAKEAATPDALKRDPLSKYTEGWFHVTLNVRDEAPVLGFIAGNAEAADGAPDEPRCVLTELGRKVEEEWRGIGRFYPACICEEIKAMPDHIHALLHLLPANRGHLGRIINGLMIGCTHAYWDTLGIPWREMRQQIDDALKRHNNCGGPTASTREQNKALRAQWQDRDHTRSFRGPSLFVRGYNDVEAIGEDEIEIKRQYIRNNPRKWLITRTAPDCFRIHRNMKSANWTPERIMLGLCADRFIAADRNRQVEAWRQITTKGIRNSRGKVSATLKFQTSPTTTATTTTAATTAAATAATAAATTTATTTTTAATAAATAATTTATTTTTTATTTTATTTTATTTTTAAATAATTTTAATAAATTTNTPADAMPTTYPVIELVGNTQLLERPLFPLVCHRADAHLYEQQKAAVLKVAREQGGVIVTVCVSPKERDIVKMLQQEQLPVIEVMDNGFSEKYKPTGKDFYAVAEGRRLEISPWEYEYRRREMCPVKDEQGRPVLNADGNPEMEEIPDITREMCMVMNELVRLIAKREDGWWK